MALRHRAANLLLDLRKMGVGIDIRGLFMRHPCKSRNSSAPAWQVRASRQTNPGVDMWSKTSIPRDVWSPAWWRQGHTILHQFQILPKSKNLGRTCWCNGSCRHIRVLDSNLCLVRLLYALGLIVKKTGPVPRLKPTFEYMNVLRDSCVCELLLWGSMHHAPCTSCPSNS